MSYDNIKLLARRLARERRKAERAEEARQLAVAKAERAEEARQLAVATAQALQLKREKRMEEARRSAAAKSLAKVSKRIRLRTEKAEAKRKATTISRTLSQPPSPRASLQMPSVAEFGLMSWAEFKDFDREWRVNQAGSPALAAQPTAQELAQQQAIDPDRNVEPPAGSSGDNDHEAPADSMDKAGAEELQVRGKMVIEPPVRSSVSERIRVAKAKIDAASAAAAFAPKSKPVRQNPKSPPASQRPAQPQSPGSRLRMPSATEISQMGRAEFEEFNRAWKAQKSGGLPPSADVRPSQPVADHVRSEVAKPRPAPSPQSPPGRPRGWRWRNYGHSHAPGSREQAAGVDRDIPPTDPRVHLREHVVTEVREQTVILGAILEQIFDEDAPPRPMAEPVPEPPSPISGEVDTPLVVPPPAPTVPVQGADVVGPARSDLQAIFGLPGLDRGHSLLAEIIARRPRWRREVLAPVATALDLMLDGALEKINDAAFDAFEMPFTEGDDPIEVNPDFLEAAAQ